MIRTNVHLTEEHRNKLHKISKETDVPVAAIIRRAISIYLRSIEDREPSDYRIVKGRMK